MNVVVDDSHGATAEVHFYFYFPAPDLEEIQRHINTELKQLKQFMNHTNQTSSVVIDHAIITPNLVSLHLPHRVS